MQYYFIPRHPESFRPPSPDSFKPTVERDPVYQLTGEAEELFTSHPDLVSQAQEPNGDTIEEIHLAGEGTPREALVPNKETNNIDRVAVVQLSPYVLARMTSRDGTVQYGLRTDTHHA